MRSATRFFGSKKTASEAAIAATAEVPTRNRLRNLLRVHSFRSIHRSLESPFRLQSVTDARLA